MTKLRTWLENNKVFFETIAAILISLMALLVSWSQLNASRVQNNLARLQTRISEQSVMPHFVINAKQLKGSPQNSTFDEDKLTIENHGAVISNFRSDYVVSFDVELVNQIGHKKHKSRFFVNGYYSGQGYTAEGKGLLVTIEGYQNNHKFSVLSRRFSDVAQANNNYNDISVHRFVMIRYTDLLGKKYREYYYVPLIYGASRISQEEGEEIFREDKNSFGTPQRFDMDEITPEELHSIMLQLSPSG